MKILHVFDFFSPGYGGGVVTFVYQVSKALARREHEIVIYTSDFKLNKEYIDSLYGSKVYPFHNWFSSSNIYLMPGIIREAKGELRDFDIIHLHCLRSFQNIVIHNYAKKYGIPYVLQAHGSLTTFFQKGWLKKTFDMVWGDRILRDASRVIAITEEEARQYRSMAVSEKKIEIIPNFIDLSEFDNLPPKGEFRKKHNLDSKEKIILYLGRIHKIKGLDLLAQVLSGLSTSFNGVKLVVAGADDGYLSSLKNLAAKLDIMDKILFTGPLYGQEKLSAYVDADIYVLPSSYEIFGITVLEALACSTPVIVTDRCGIAAAVNTARAGIVVPYAREELQKALLQMLNDDKMRLQLGENGRLLVQEKFSSERMAEQMEKLYNEITKESKK